MRQLLSKLNVWLVVGVFFLCSMLSMVGQTLSPLFQGEATIGEVIEVIPSRRREPQQVIVRFQTTAGQAVTTRINGHPFYRYEPGQQLSLYYQPNNPQQITLPELIWWGLLLSVPAALLFGGIPLWIGLRKRAAGRQTAVQVRS
ncbi:MAG: hypothetical protein OHK0022_55310 [Roseiflexaceae bacterium]